MTFAEGKTFPEAPWRPRVSWARGFSNQTPQFLGHFPSSLAPKAVKPEEILKYRYDLNGKDNPNTKAHLRSPQIHED